jgi:CheY-like chemotaxis protein
LIRIIRNLLKQLGFEDVDDASDGSAALAKLREKKYGLVISDWNMEPMTGYELLKEVRADPGLHKTPFIMVTAESKTENVIAAEEGGREQLHRQAVQRADAQDQDRGGVRRVIRPAQNQNAGTSRRAPRGTSGNR